MRAFFTAAAFFFFSAAAALAFADIFFLVFLAVFLADFFFDFFDAFFLDDLRFVFYNSQELIESLLDTPAAFRVSFLRWKTLKMSAHDSTSPRFSLGGSAVITTRRGMDALVGTQGR